MGTRSNRLVDAVLTSIHNPCFEQKYEKCQNFLSENFHFLMVKFSAFSNRHVFVMNAIRRYLRDTGFLQYRFGLKITGFYSKIMALNTKQGKFCLKTF